MGQSVGLVLLLCILCSDSFEFSQPYNEGLCFKDCTVILLSSVDHTVVFQHHTGKFFILVDCMGFFWFFFGLVDYIV